MGGMLKACLLVFLLFQVSAKAAPPAEALSAEGEVALYKRVLSLAGARMHDRSGESFKEISEKDVPVFTPYYVYDEYRGKAGNWYLVGKKPKNNAEGWLAANTVEQWNNQLVMTYMPRGRRGRVLYFDSLDQLLKITREPGGSVRAKKMLTNIETGKETPEGIIAIEPWEYIDYVNSPYLMPIFSHREDTIRGGGKANLLQVACLNLETGNPDVNEKLTPPAEKEDVAELKEFKVGIVFVMDTTASMGPYIQRTYEVVEKIYQILEESGDLKRVSFGLVGYRDSTAPDPRIEYLTRVFQSLDPDASPAETLRNLHEVKPASVPTKNWDEDAYAGIRTAVERMDWTPFDARFVVLVSDAGPRQLPKCKSGQNPGKDQCDKFASLTSGDLAALKGEIDRKKLAVMTLHLLTPEGVKDHQSARQSYTSVLGKTGDKSLDKYLGIRGGTVEEFTKEIQAFAGQLQQAVAQAAQGKMVEVPEPSKHRGKKPDIGELLVFEIFRAQTEYLGKVRGTDAPRVYRAWTADKDLTQPSIQALDVRVLLTKDQLNTLAGRLSEIVPAFKAGQLDAKEGWEQLIALSGRFTTDPSRRDFVELGDSGILPDYLAKLPYKSKILGLSFAGWKALSTSGQRNEVRRMEDLLDVYRSLAQDDRVWIDLGSGDPNLSVYPISLDDLP